MSRREDASPRSILSLFLRMGGMATGVMLIFTLVLTGASVNGYALAERFEVEGREATATVTDRERVESTDSDGDTDITHYLTLDYETREGEAHSTRRSVGRATFEDHEVGDRITLRYLESRPSLIELEAGENADHALFAKLAALLCGLATLGFLWLYGGRAVAATRARQYGEEVTATVQRLEDKRLPAFARNGVRLVWQDTSGREGRSLPDVDTRLADYPPGTQITVYRGLRRDWWAGDTGRRPESARSP